jgi:hypothetical protein
MMATSKLPRLMLPKLYVKARFKAPRVAPLGNFSPSGLKYQEP